MAAQVISRLPLPMYPPMRWFAIEIFGKDIQNANGVSIRFEYDASQVTYEGFDHRRCAAQCTGTAITGYESDYVEIGIASLGGQATANSGLIGTVRFRTTAAFSGTTIRSGACRTRARGGDLRPSP